MIAWLTHLWRLLTAVTLYRNVRPELDEKDDAPLELAAGPVEGLAPMPTPASLAEIALPLPPAPLPDHSFAHPIAAAPVALAYAPPIVEGLQPLEVDDRGWLHGDKVVKVPTARKGYRMRGEKGRATDRPAGYLQHWTATPHGTALGMVRRSSKLDPDEGGWVHLWLEHDGTIYQSGSFLVGAPHAGHEKAHRMKVVGGEPAIASRKESTFSANSFFIGCECVCVGEVRRMKKVGGVYVKVDPHSEEGVWISWPYGKPDDKGKPRGHIVKDIEVVDGKDRDGVHRFYQKFTTAQLDAIERILRALRARYGFSDSSMSWDHADVDPKRKSDAGLWKTRWLPGILSALRRR